MFRNENDWINEYRQRGALWIHDQNPKRPHALLASGNHSGGFFNSRLVISDDALLDEAAHDLLELFVREGGDISMVRGVVGPQTGATRLSRLMSNRITAHTGGNCFWASPAKMEKDGKKSMVFGDDDLAFLPGQPVLLCEDVLTTGGSVDLAATAVANGGGIILPFVLVLVNRSGLADEGGKKILALVSRPMPMWEPRKCPLCAEGSEAVRPKDNWDLLNGPC